MTALFRIQLIAPGRLARTVRAVHAAVPFRCHSAAHLSEHLVAKVNARGDEPARLASHLASLLPHIAGRSPESDDDRSPSRR
jgi:hypothetical protein